MEDWKVDHKIFIELHVLLYISDDEISLYVVREMRKTWMRFILHHREQLPNKNKKIRKQNNKKRSVNKKKSPKYVKIIRTSSRWWYEHE